MWREGYVTVYPDHRCVKHLLNPCRLIVVPCWEIVLIECTIVIGELFTDPGEAERLLAQASVASPPAHVLGRTSPGLSSANADSDINAGARSLNGLSGTQSGQGEGFASAASPQTPAQDPAESSLIRTSDQRNVRNAQEARAPSVQPNLSDSMASVFHQLGEAAGKVVVQDQRGNTWTFEIPTPIDPQLLATTGSPDVVNATDKVALTGTTRRLQSPLPKARQSARPRHAQPARKRLSGPATPHRPQQAKKSSRDKPRSTLLCLLRPMR